MLCEECNKLPLSVAYEDLEWSWVLLCWSPSEGFRGATSDQSMSTRFLGIRATLGTSDAKACVGVLAVLPSICQKSSMFLHITHWQSCLPSKNIMKCSLYPQISPPLPKEEMEKPVSPHTHRGFAFVTKKRWKTFKFTQKIYQETRTVNLDLFEQTWLTRGYADF